MTIKPNEAERPWLSWICTPANQLYLVKTRMSAAGMMSYGAIAMAILNPAAAVGVGGKWFVEKQRLKHSLSKLRKEQSPSLVPKVLARKCWFVDLEKYEPYEYADHLLVKNLL